MYGALNVMLRLNATHNNVVIHKLMPQEERDPTRWYAILSTTLVGSWEKPVPGGQNYT
jgi:hypothetical protein